MPDIEALKCPNCGGSIHGQGEVKCEYCGSMLSISKRADARTTQPQYVVTFSQSERTIAFFNDLPGKVISITTTDIPYEPGVIYTNLPGGQLDPACKADADQILMLFGKVQDALNAENLDQYLSAFSPGKPDYIAEVKGIVQQQFAYSDLKRYTVSIDFIALTPDRAEVIVTNESLTFPVAGPFERLEVQFRYQLEKYQGNWKIAGSVLEKKAAKESTIGKALVKVFVIVGIIVVISVLATICLSVGGSFCGVCGSLGGGFVFTDEEGDISLGKFEGSPENDEAIGRTVEISLLAKFYCEPTTSADTIGLLGSGDKVTIVAAYEDYWLRVKDSEGLEGWIRGGVYGDKLEMISGDSTCPIYDPTGEQNKAYIGRKVVTGSPAIWVYEQPSEKSGSVFVAHRDDRLLVRTTTSDFWVELQNDESEVGWGRCCFVGEHIYSKRK